jgi:flagellar biosynthesis chaperone FliJ
MLEDIRAIRIKIKVAQQRSFRLQNELQEGRTRYEEFASHCDRLRTRLLQLSGYQREYTVNSRFHNGDHHVKLPKFRLDC